MRYTLRLQWQLLARMNEATESHAAGWCVQTIDLGNQIWRSIVNVTQFISVPLDAQAPVISKSTPRFLFVIPYGTGYGHFLLCTAATSADKFRYLLRAITLFMARFQNCIFSWLGSTYTKQKGFHPPPVTWYKGLWAFTVNCSGIIFTYDELCEEYCQSHAVHIRVRQCNECNCPLVLWNIIMPMG